MKNNKYFQKLWIRALAIALPFLIFCIFGAIHNTSLIPLILFSIASSVIMMFIIRTRTKSNIGKYFLYESSDTFIKYFDTILNRSIGLKDKDVWLVYNKCLVYCYYGEFQKSLDLLSVIDWDKKVPYMQSLFFSIKALISYLQKDFREGLRLSLIAQGLGEISGNFPGVEKTRDFYDTYIKIGELLEGSARENTVQSLEDKFSRYPLFPKLLIAWCLSVFYTNTGSAEKAAEKKSYCRMSAPYCKPLLDS